MRDFFILTLSASYLAVWQNPFNFGPNFIPVSLISETQFREKLFRIQAETLWESLKFRATWLRIQRWDTVRRY